MGTSAPTPSSLGKHLNGKRAHNMALQLISLARSGFEYSESLTDRHIRLLNLNFGHSDEMVHLDIKTYSIDDHPPYIALSYTWGNPKHTVPVLCNGRVINVTLSLQEALWQFREDRKRLMRPKSSATSHSQPLYLWVDAICINQSNNKEKSFQVGLMAEIYRRARHVFVWLGPTNRSSDVAIRCIDKVGKMADTHGMEHTIDAFDDWDNQNNWLPITELKSFFTRLWWTRMWVLQEVTLSRDTHFICGAQKLPRARYEDFIHIYSALWLRATDIRRGQKSTICYQGSLITNLFHHRPTVLLSMARVYHENRFPMAALLRATCVGSINLNRHGPHNFESTKPEDKVFALLGLAADKKELENFGVVPNYDVPYEETYTILMAALLRQGHISLLSMCQTPRSPNLPSWVPDWSRSMTGTLQDVRDDHMTLYPSFRASGYQTNGTSVGHFPNRTNSKEVPFEQTFKWPVEWLLENMRLSYCTKKDYNGFHNRLRASARNSIGDVGWNKSREYNRVGNDRFDDAVILLHDGLKYIEEGPLKLDAQPFITNQKVEHVAGHRIRNELQLAMEIMGKSLGRIPFVTQKGHLGLSSEHVKQGDKIAIIAGSQVPFVLRSEDKGHFTLVSEAYVDGIMDGEVAKISDFRDITLV